MPSTTTILALIVAVASWTPTLGQAHGVTHRELKAGTGIKASYDSGKPMAYCDASVFSPDDPENAYQAGSTDPHGCFAFVPDTNGVWSVVVDDGMGHVVTAKVAVDTNQPPLPSPLPHNDGDRRTRMVVGLSVIFGLFGAYSLVRQATRHVTSGDRPGKGDRSCTSPKA
jgi:nickel transport protein